MQRVIGLMSGTSADGVDTALVEFQDESLRPQVRVLAHATDSYDAARQAQILAASYPESSSVDLICHLHVALGECFAVTAIAVAQAAGVPLDQIDLIGSHGQTIYHIPEASTTPLQRPSTLQIGGPCVIAEHTGIATVADFRPCDMAWQLAPADVVRTCTAFTAASIRDNYHCFIWPRWTITEVMIGGGGLYNAELMRLLRDGLALCAVTPPDTYGYPNEALETSLIALLAHATAHGRPGNVPGATGARRAVVLGKIVPG